MFEKYLHFPIGKILDSPFKLSIYSSFNIEGLQVNVIEVLHSVFGVNDLHINETGSKHWLDTVARSKIFFESC